MGRPTFKCEMAFGVAPLTDPGAWTDVTPYWRQGQGRRGKDHELAQSQAGEWIVRFRNTDRRFEPFFAGSPYYPNVVPMTHIRITATANAVTYPVARGYVENFEQKWPGRPIGSQGDAECVAHCVDAFKLLSLWQLPNSYLSEVMLDKPIVYYPLDDPAASLMVAGSPTNLWMGRTMRLGDTGPLLGGATAWHTDGGDPTYGGGALQGGDNGPFPPAVSSANTSDLCNIQAPQDTTFECWVNIDSLASAGAGGGVYPFGLMALQGFLGSGEGPGSLQQVALNSSQFAFWFWGQAGAAVGHTDPSWTLPVGVWTHVAVVKSGYTCTFYRNGVPMKTSVAGDFGAADTYCRIWIGSGTHGNEAGFPGRMTHVAVYDTALSPARIAAHYAAKSGRLPQGKAGAQLGNLLDIVGWPAGLRTIDAGVLTLAPFDPSGSRLSSLLAVGEDSELSLFQMGADGKVIYHDKADLQSVSGTHWVSQATFGDSGAELGYADLVVSFDDQDLWTSVAVTAASGAVQVVKDAAAAVTFGDRTLAATSDHLSDLDALDRANYLLASYKAPAGRPVSVSLILAADDVMNQTVLGLDTHAARVTVIRRPQGGGAPITWLCAVEGVDFDIPAVGSWHYTLHLVPWPGGKFWLLEDAAQGLLEQTTVEAW